MLCDAALVTCGRRLGGSAPLNAAVLTATNQQRQKERENGEDTLPLYQQDRLIFLLLRTRLVRCSEFPCVI